jgi:hypothetical protein
MQGAEWISLLQLIPERLHNELILTTPTGIDLTLQQILRTEEAYLVVRGRVAGTNDAGRIFFVPYAQISFLGIQKQLKEEEVLAWYGATPRPRAASAAEPAAEAAEAAPPAEELAPGESEPAGETPVAEDGQPKPAAPRPVNKMELLERIRSRSHPGFRSTATGS